MQVTPPELNPFTLALLVIVGVAVFGLFYLPVGS